MSLSPQEFSEFRRFLKDAAGIDLGDNKQYLVTTRIRKILARHKFESIKELLSRVRLPSERNLRQEVIDAMTTNETFWFRDVYPFDYLKATVFPELIQDNPRLSPRIWCAACSSGQEPYSISMIADEFKRSGLGRSNFTVDIHATDLSSEILDHAKAGTYDKLSISRGMSDQRLRSYFEAQPGNQWVVKADIKKSVRFRALNLQESFISLGKFDIVFCRNVLIYFSSDLKQDILRRIHATIKPGGLLFLGSSESLGDASELFSMVHCRPGVVYQAK